MKWFSMLGLLALGCGDDGDAAPEGCAGLSIDACEDDASCTVLDLRPWTGRCWQSATAAACVPARGTCAPLSGCFVDGDGKRWLGAEECLPEGWHEASGDECSGQPACN
jgi:hypothetical protein